MPCWYYFSRPQNVACHDLTTVTPPPANFKSLLGLGLNFSPAYRYTTNYRELGRHIERFRCNLYNSYLYTRDLDEEQIEQRKRQFNPKYYEYDFHSRSVPARDRVPIELRSRFGAYKKGIRKLFHKKRGNPNLLPSQLRLLSWLRQQSTHIIGLTDKNLGPFIIERPMYVKWAFSDHLGNTTQYQQLTEAEANTKMEEIQSKVDELLRNGKYFEAWSEQEQQYIRKYAFPTEEALEKNKDKLYPQFYLGFKVHKEKLGTRPIVSMSGSCLYGLSKWVDQQLQPIVRRIQSYVESSYTFLDDIKEEGPFGPRTSLFTADAQGMYNNIDTDHALEILKDFFENHSICRGFDWEPVYEALELIMRNNLFKFSDCFFLQLIGTAMGTPAAPVYAILYFAIREMTLERFKAFIIFYRRYIDDVFGVWKHHHDTELDISKWREFQRTWNNHGILKWTFSKRSKKCEFLDPRLSIDKTGHISSDIYEKAMNLYLYLPPGSAHPPGVLKGLVFGMIYRITTLTNDDTRRRESLKRFYNRLLRRGYAKDTIVPIFKEGWRRYSVARPKLTAEEREANKNIEDAFVIHFPYHPDDPPSGAIQRVLRNTLFEPKGPGEEPLRHFPSHFKVPMMKDRAIIAYHKSKSLRNYLSPRKFDNTPGPTASAIMDEDASGPV